MKIPFIRATSLVVAVFNVAPAAAHVTLAQDSAPAGSYYTAVFRVGHGCDGSPTERLEVSIPEGIMSAKPMPKAGWDLSTLRGRLKQPYQSHGKTITEDVNMVVWEDGSLPDDFYDEFVIRMRLPESAGPYYFTITQVCEEGRLDWDERPAAGQAAQNLRRPAVLLEVLPVKEPRHH